MTESSGDLIPPEDRIMEEFSKPLSSLLKKLYAQSLGSPELRMKNYLPRWSK